MFVFTTPAPAAAVVRGWTEHLTTLRSDLDGYGPVPAEPVADERMVRWLMAWSTVFGHVSLELFGHMHRGVLDYDAHFAQVTRQLVADLGVAS